MIVVETLLREIFTQLPPYKDSNLKEYPIRYGCGNLEDLTLFLKEISGNKYPLVWLVEGKQTVDRYAHSVERDCIFYLAKNSENKTKRNLGVLDSEFVNCLNPLLENVLTALESSGATSIIGKFKEQRHANYTDNNQTLATDHWNVIVLEITVQFKEKANGEPLCLKTIKFKSNE